MPGGNHTFPAELEVEFTDIEPNLSVSSVPSLSHVQLFATPWNGFSVHHQFPELAHTHVHQISAAIQPSHPLSSPSPLAFSLSLFSTPSLAFIPCRLLDRSHSDWCEMVPHSGLDLHFSDNE